MEKRDIPTFMNSTYCINLVKDMFHAERLVHHALDN